MKRKPKAVNTPLPYFIVHELDKPGNSATVSTFIVLLKYRKGKPMPYKPTGRRVGRPEKEDAYKPVSVKLPPDLLERVRQYALIHQQSLSELIRDGLEWRISEGDG